MTKAMHLYETHLPVKDTEVSSRFYVDVVGLEFAHRDLTRDIVFLWVGSNKRSMLGLWGPNTSRGHPHPCHFAIAISLPELLAAGPRLGTLGVGESISSGVVSVWHKKSGEQVKKGDPLFTLETDKVSTEIVAEADGVLKTKAAEGQEVKIGEVVAEIEESNAAAEAPPAKKE